MVDVSLAEIFVFVVGGVLLAVPMGRIFQRAGFSWAWGLLLLVPYLGWVIAWLLLAARTWRWRRAS